MMLPVLDLKKNYRAIQSSLKGTIYFQEGHVFEEGGKYVGMSPVWGDSLFLDEKREPADAYAKALAYAHAHVPKFDLSPDDPKHPSQLPPAPEKKPYIRNPVLPPTYSPPPPRPTPAPPNPYTSTSPVSKEDVGDIDDVFEKGEEEEDEYGEPSEPLVEDEEIPIKRRPGRHKKG